jgi:hypothetical protein
MAFAKMSVREDRRIKRLLNRLPDECTGQVKDAIAHSGQELFDAMVQRVPIRTGKLAASIGFRTARNGLAALVGFSKQEFPKQWKEAGFRAHFTEFGTKGSSGGGVSKSGGRKRRHVATPARPFVLPALIEKGPTIIEEHKRAVDQALQQASAYAGDSVLEDI